MFLEVRSKDIPRVTEHLKEILSARFPDCYPGWLAEGMSPQEADRQLVEQGLIGEMDLLDLYCEELKVEPLAEMAFELPEKIDDFSGTYLAAHSVLPLRIHGDSLVVAVSSPYELEQIEYVLSTFFERKIFFEIARRGMVTRMVERIYLDAGNEENNTNSPLVIEEDELRRMADESGVVRLVSEMFSQALEMGASDIHIEPEEGELNIRFRVDGVINDYLKLPVGDYPAIASRIKLIGGLNIAERRLPQDGRTTFQFGANEMDIRISTIPILNGESIVLRLLDKNAMKFDLKELGMNAELLQDFEKLIRIPYGIILVVGPTGSGKTTTLYSVMCSLNDRHRKIITIEDPVEYQLPGLSQMQVNPKIGLTFANGLRSIVRQDPDVILVGEIRDKETADIAINAALTGHLVLSTLHTNDAVGAVVRLIDMGIEPFLITASLAGVLSQRLIRKVCPVCHGSGELFHGNRCRSCGGSGFRGRSGIFEFLQMNADLKDAVHRQASNTEIEKIALAHGMIPLLEDGLKKVRNGETTRTELFRSVAGISEGEMEHE